MTYVEIRVPNWEKFQHYKKRRPPWIKNHVDLLSRPEYTALTAHQRAVLHGLWLWYSQLPQGDVNHALTPRHHRVSTATLSRQLELRVMTRDLEALNHAGFLDIRASTLQADRKQDASALYLPEAEAEAEAEVLSTDRPLDELDVTQKPEPWEGNTEWARIDADDLTF